MDNDDEIAAYLQYLEDEGILEWVGMDTSGERTFVFRFDIMMIKMPELFDALMSELNDELMNLYRMGLVEVEYDEKLNARFSITEDGKKYLELLGMPMPEDWNSDE